MKPSILILSAGRRVSLLKCFEAAASEADMRVICADMNPLMSSACQMAGEAYTLPHIAHADYAASLEELCKQQQVALVVPTLDTELALLADLRERFSRLGVTLVVSDGGLIAACRDKRMTVDYFGRFGLISPKIYSPSAIEYPAIVKPLGGSLSKGIHVLPTESASWAGLFEDPQNIFCEYLDPAKHDEFTCDGYYDRHGSLRCLIPRQRLEVRGGEVSKARAVKGRAYDFLLSTVRHLPGARGCLTIQVMVNRETGEVRLIECNPRFGGGYPLTAEAGGPYHQWLIDEYVNDCDIPFYDGWEDGLTMLRYDGEVFTSCG